MSSPILTPESLALETRNFILNTGEVKALDGDEMCIEGWASTKGIDLSGDVVLPTAFQKNWDFYATKGRYWINHNPDLVIGRVKQAHLTDNGFYIDKAKLAETRFNLEYVWPLVKEGALNEHSIQFQSLKPYVEKGIRYHHELLLIETSIVSVACNPEAVITDFKKLLTDEEVDYDNKDWTIEEMYKMFSEGRLLLPTDKFTKFYFSFPNNEILTEKNKTEHIMAEEVITTPKTLSPDFADITAVEYSGGYVSEGNIKPLPSKKSKNYDDVCSSVFLAKSEVRGSYLFRVADHSDNGAILSFKNLALTLGSLLGAKGGYHMQEDTKLNLLEKVFTLYKKLGKEIPTLENTPLDELANEFLLSTKYTDVDFTENEKQFIAEDVLAGNINAIKMALSSKDLISEEALTELKGVWGEIYVGFSVYPYDEADFKFVQLLISLYEAYNSGAFNEDNDDDTYMMSAEQLSLFEDFSQKVMRNSKKAESGKIINDVEKAQLEQIQLAQKVAEQFKDALTRKS